MGAEEIEGAFAPGAEVMEGVGEGVALLCSEILGTADGDSGGGEGGLKGVE